MIRINRWSISWQDTPTARASITASCSTFNRFVFHVSSLRVPRFIVSCSTFHRFVFHVSSLRVLRFIRINRRRPTPGPHKPSSGRGPAAQAAAPLFRPAPAAALISSYPTSLVTRPHISSGPVKSPPGDMGGHVAFPAHGGDSPGPRSQAVPVRPLLYRPGYPNAAQRPLLYRPSCIGLSAGPGPRAQISRGRSSLSRPGPRAQQTDTARLPPLRRPAGPASAYPVFSGPYLPARFIPPHSPLSLGAGIHGAERLNRSWDSRPAPRPAASGWRRVSPGGGTCR